MFAILFLYFVGWTALFMGGIGTVDAFVDDQNPLAFIILMALGIYCVLATLRALQHYIHSDGGKR